MQEITDVGNFQKVIHLKGKVWISDAQKKMHIHPHTHIDLVPLNQPHGNKF